MQTRSLVYMHGSERACKRACMLVLAVAATKGGVGKTTLAYELAAALNGVLVDLEWDGGSATAMWGHDPAAFRRVPILDALEAGPGGPPPRIRRKPHQPSLVPGHPDLGASNIPDDLVADCLQAWAVAWGDIPVVVDTHPGADALTDGAMAAFDVVVVPVVLAAREMDGLERLLADWASYRLLLVPNKVPPGATAAVGREAWRPGRGDPGCTCHLRSSVADPASASVGSHPSAEPWPRGGPGGSRVPRGCPSRGESQ
jgi:chromosome partitioning protein